MLVDTPRQHAAATSRPSSRSPTSTVMRSPMKAAARTAMSTGFSFVPARRRSREAQGALGPAANGTIGLLMGVSRGRPGVIGPPNRRTSTMPPASGASTKASIRASARGGRPTILTASGKGPVPPRIRGRARSARLRDRSFIGPACSRGEPYALQLLQTADDETARLRIIDARMVQPQADEAESSAAIRIAASRRVQRSASASRARAERISRSGLEPSSAETRSARNRHLRRRVPRDANAGVGVPWAMPTPSPVPRSLSISPTRARVKALRSSHLGGILRRDDEAETMPVVEAASREGHGVGAVLGGAKHAALLAIPGDPVALEVGDVGRQRRRAEGPPLMVDHPGLDDDATVGGEQTAAGERGATSPERRAGCPRDHPSLPGVSPVFSPVFLYGWCRKEP
jgi:hypothetical protein